MKPTKLIMMAIAVITIVSCKKDKGDDPATTSGDTVTADSIILAYKTNFPSLWYSSNHLLTSSKLMQDTTSHDTVWTPKNFTITRNNADHNKVKHLLYTIPSQILNENGTHYGVEAGLDCPFTVLTAYINGQTYRWEFEDCTDSIPAHALQYTMDVSAAVQYLD